MRYSEALTLKPGDLVVTDGRNESYNGLVLEIESISPQHDYYCRRVTLKQPGFNNGFCIRDYDSRRLKRYEP